MSHGPSSKSNKWRGRQHGSFHRNWAASETSGLHHFVETDRTGVVDNFNKGYGFITVDDEENRRSYNRNVFVHHQDMSMPTLRKGDSVKFDIVLGNEKRHRAVNVCFADPPSSLSPAAADAIPLSRGRSFDDTPQHVKQLFRDRETKRRGRGRPDATADDCVDHVNLQDIMKVIESMNERLLASQTAAATAPEISAEAESRDGKPGMGTNARRGVVTDREHDSDFTIVLCDDPPEHIFGYATTCDLKAPLTSLKVGQRIIFDVKEEPTGSIVLKNIELIADPSLDDDRHSERHRRRRNPDPEPHSITEDHEVLRTILDARSERAYDMSESGIEWVYNLRGSVTYREPNTKFTIVRCDNPEGFICSESFVLKPPMTNLKVGQRIKFDVEKGTSQGLVLRNVRLTSSSSHQSSGTRRGADIDHSHSDPPGATAAISTAEEELQSLKDELKCSICRDLLAMDSVITQCGHYFCRQCIQQWLMYRAVCPYCKTRLTTSLKPIHPMIKNILERTKASKRS